MKKITIGKSIQALGKHMTTKVKATPIEHNLDDREAALGPAKAIAKMVEDRIKGITQQAAPKTIEARKRKGQTSTTVFKVTGYLANGIHMTEDSPGRFQTRAPQGRLGPETPWITRNLLKVIDLNAQTIMQVPEVKKAVEANVRRMIKKGRR